MQSSDAGATRVEPAAGVSCRLKELTKLTKWELRAILTDFVSTNWNSSQKSKHWQSFALKDFSF